MLVALQVWANDWAHSTVKFKCDNLAVVQVVASGKTRNEFLNACLRNIWFVTASYDIDLQIEHIQGHKNIMAVSLSRIFSHKGISHSMLHHLVHDYTWKRPRTLQARRTHLKAFLSVLVSTVSTGYPFKFLPGIC